MGDPTRFSIVDADISKSLGCVTVGFYNPFTGKIEDFTTQDAAINSMLQAAAVRIEALEQEVSSMKATQAWVRAVYAPPSVADLKAYVPPYTGPTPTTD